MEADLLSKLEESDLSTDLKTALSNYYAELERMLPGLPPRYQWQLKALSEHILEEITDPAIEVHWWEMALDLAIRWTAPVEGPDGSLARGARQLRDLLRESMEPYSDVKLVELTEDTVRGVCLLSETLDDPQRSMVADNAISLAQAHFSKFAWFRAIYAGKAPVGFVLLYDDPEAPEYFLWRFMVAGPYQGRGYGRDALELLADYVRTRPDAEELGVSCGQGPGSPEGFYTKFGFEQTGEMAGDEVMLKLVL